MNVRIIWSLAVLASVFLLGCGSEVGDKDKVKLIADESGIQYADLVEGTGERCQVGDTIRVGYTTRLRNGMVANTSDDGSGPIDVHLGGGGVIKGWELGIPGMRVGGVRKLVIPPALGFGSQPKPNIPPNSELTVEIKLLEIVDKSPRRSPSSKEEKKPEQEKKD
ncbi:MAG TPA: FKBP-type peptidyl-prolyl cis-trans isomerase [Gemmataceae bacterium]|jgi:FKBP-type peptidyl-prolyl cis-trans isomerase|nr:FKBP-type peptidyl-prolyl cis-trans isomerase [Gemmataceae bacterium]